MGAIARSRERNADRCRARRQTRLRRRYTGRSRTGARHSEAKMKTKIAYQGEPGANSHIACRHLYPDGAPLALPSFEDVLAGVSDGVADYAMIPIENSVAGRV